MKTKRTLLYILTLVLSVFCVQTSLAQAEQNALYIFRNDGGFKAFFYGDIDHIEYSKIDTLGMEHDDYVVQEVYALDSVFRIPLSAIDSVAFVTPETIIKKDVFCPDASIANYIIASDSINWIKLATNTPQALIPKVGDKFYIKEASQFVPHCFIGLVTEVTKGDDGYVVSTGYLELTDIFDRLVEKFAAATTPESADSRRRGLIDGTEVEFEMPIEFPTISVTIPLQGSYALLESGPFKLTGDLTGSISLNYAPKWELRAFLFVDALSGTLNYDETIRVISDNECSASIAGSFTGHVDFPLKELTIKCKKSDLLEFKLSTGLFLEGQFTGFSGGYTYKAHETLRSHASYRTVDEGDGKPHVTNGSKTDVIENGFTGTIEGKMTWSTGVYGEAKAVVSALSDKKPAAGAPAQKKEKWFELSTRLDGGLKLEYDVPYISALGNAYNMLKTQTFYSLLNQESNVTLAAFVKWSGNFSLGKLSFVFSPELDIMKSNIFGIVPDISDIHVAYDETTPHRPYRIKATSPIRRDLLLGTYVGFAAYDESDKLVDDWCKQLWIRENISKITSYDHVFTTLDPAKDKEKTYTVYPEVEIGGKRILVDKQKKFTLTPAHIDVSRQVVYVSETLGAEDVEVVPNMANMEAKSEAAWIDEPIWYPDENKLTLKWSSMSDNAKGRRGVVRLTGKSHKGEVLAVDSIVIIQGQPYILLSNNMLNFDVDGGTQQVTITDTNVKNITVKSGAEGDYIHPSIDGNVITVKVDPNPNAEDRANAVLIEGSMGNGQKGSTFISVEQAGTGETPPTGAFMELTPESLEFEAKGGTATITIGETNLDTNTIKVISTSDYIHVTLDGKTITVTVDENTDSKERKGSVTVEGNTPEGLSYTVDIPVSQKSSEGQEQTKKVEVASVDFRGMLYYKDDNGKNQPLNIESCITFPIDNSTSTSSDRVCKCITEQFGKGIRVTATAVEKRKSWFDESVRDIITIDISFTIPDVTGEVPYEITNFSAHYKSYSVENDKTYRNFEVNATKIPPYYSSSINDFRAYYVPDNSTFSAENIIFDFNNYSWSPQTGPDKQVDTDNLRIYVSYKNN